MAGQEELVLRETDVGRIPEIVARMRAGFRANRTLSKDYRLQQLANLKRMIEEHEQEFLDALWVDLRKNKFEAIVMEVGFEKTSIARIINKLDDLMKPKYPPKDLLNKFNGVAIEPEPYGVALVISAWNYPFQLTVGPLVGAIAAGNACVIKPSEGSVATSNLFAELIPKYLDPECYAVITGAVKVSKAVLQQRFDYILFTGSSAVGKVVMRQAAENLTPVTLELGGKSPCIVTDDANINVAGRRIVWGKCINAGQTCIAPDYVICPAAKQDKLVAAMKSALLEFFGEDPSKSDDFGRIVNDHHYQRVKNLMNTSTGTIVHGGQTDDGTRYIAPTIITGVSPDDKIMQEEIFGPVLPIVCVDGVDNVIDFLNDREKPLAFYVFTESKKTFLKISRHTSAGGVTHNDVLMHCGVPSLPFGGVGHSGYGAYHGKYSFDTFTHYKPHLSTGTGLEALMKIRYAPFTEAKLKRMNWLMGPGGRGGAAKKLFALFLLIAVAAVAIQVFGVPDWVHRLLPF